MDSNKSTTELCSPLDETSSIMDNRWLMAKKSLSMMEKMMYPNIIDYYVISCAIPAIITITTENRYQIDFGLPGGHRPCIHYEILSDLWYQYLFIVWTVKGILILLTCNTVLICYTALMLRIINCTAVPPNPKFFKVSWQLNLHCTCKEPCYKQCSYLITNIHHLMVGMLWWPNMDWMNMFDSTWTIVDKNNLRAVNHLDVHN